MAGTRNATRDYVDLAALADKLGVDEAAHALACMDALYPQRSGESPMQQLMKQLAEPRPYDLDETHLSEYRELEQRWHEWGRIVTQCQAVGVKLMDFLIATSPGSDSSSAGV